MRSLLRNHLPGRGELGGAIRSRGSGGDVLPQTDRLLRREGKGGVARSVGGDGLRTEERLALVPSLRIGEELYLESLPRGAVEIAPDGRGAGGRLLRGGEDGLVLEVVGAGVGVVGIVGGGPEGAVEVYTEAEV